MRVYGTGNVYVDLGFEDAEQRLADADRPIEAVRKALASARLAGVEISPETQAEVDRYAAGGLTADELVDRVLAIHGGA